MIRASRGIFLALAYGLLAGCGGGEVLQPDRAIFSLDAHYQRFALSMPIEDAFDRTVSVFREAGYKLDVVDRATGQISGRRGTAGAGRTGSDKDLKFYALVLPSGDYSVVSLKIVQVLNSGPLKSSKAELIVTEPMMYQFAFRRIENGQSRLTIPGFTSPQTSSSGELPPATR